MKSRTLSFSLMMETFKKQIWVFAVSCLAYFLVYPVMGMMSIGQWKEYHEMTLKLMQKLFFWSLYGSPYQTSEQLSVILSVTVLLGIISAIAGFSYLHSRTKVDFYHSLPIRKEKLFLNQLAVSTMIYLIPAFVGMILMIGVGALNNVFTLKAFGGGLAAVFVGLVFYLMSFALAALAMLLTGRLLVGILGTMVFFGYAILLQQLGYVYCGIFFHNYVNENIDRSQSLLSGLGIYGTPLGLSEYVARNLNHGNGWILTIASMIATIVLLALCVFVYQKRPSEAAGTSMVFPGFAAVVKVILTGTAALLMGYVARSVDGGIRSDRDGWFVFGLVFGVILFHCIIQMIYQPDIRKIISGKISFVVTCVLVAAIGCIFRFDLFGYDRYLPKQDEIVNLNVVMDSLLTNSWSSYSQYKSRLDRMEMGNGQELYQLAEDLIDSSERYQAEMKKLEADDEYEIDSGSVYNIHVKYELQNGRSVYRTYEVFFNDICEDVEALCNSGQHLDDLYKIRTLNPEKVQGIQLLSRESSVSRELYSEKDDKRLDFIKALQKDTQELSGTVMANETPIGKVYYDVEEEDIERYNYNAISVELYKMGQNTWISNEIAYIYPSFKNTLEILNKTGHKMESQFDLDKISEIDVVDYRKAKESEDEYGEEVSGLDEASEYVTDDEIKPVVYNDRSDMEKILPFLVWDELTSPWNDVSNDFSVEVKMINEYGTEDIYTCSLRRDEIPDILK